MRIRPTTIRVEASSVCQLQCPSCPAHSGEIRPALGNGSLRAADFKRLIDANPRLKHVELSNYGEVFLNPELLEILEYAHGRGVGLSAAEGSNFNTVSDDVLEGLVKYGFKSIICSIDGATNETYRSYRVGGDLDTVLENVRRLNSYKEQYRSQFPRLAWQFVVFGHNEHEVEQARASARELGMDFRLKLSWDPDFSPARDVEMLRREIGAATREEYEERFGTRYMASVCRGLWERPQINWDGRVLGCCRNFWGEFGGNAFTDGLDAAVNSLGMRHARAMLLGRKPPLDGIPCTTCSEYLARAETGDWLDRKGLEPSVPYRAARRVYRTLHLRQARSALRQGAGGLRIAPRSPFPRLSGAVYPLQVPLPLADGDVWTAHNFFRGSTKNLYDLESHASVLAKGRRPHPPHIHQEEEILMVLGGEVDIIVPEAATGTTSGAPVAAAGGPVADADGRIHLRSGQFVYYPAGFAHTLETTSEEPATYLMFRWREPKPVSREAAKPGEPGAAGRAPALGPLGFDLFDSARREDGREGFAINRVFEGPTGYLERLHCHLSTLTPGAGYAPHADRYDVAIVVLEGEVETLGARAVPHVVIMYPAGEPHGMYNPGEATAYYVVFEFHRRLRR